MVETLIAGVVYVPVVASKVPPEDALYQANVAPAGAVAERMTVPVPHRLAPVTVGASGTAFTVAVTAVRVGEIHPLITASA